MASSPVLKRSDTIADTIPDALKQSRYHMKKCFSREKRLMKLHHLMGEVEKSIEDKTERSKVSEGLLGYIISSTQEAAVVPPFVALAVIPNSGFWEYIKVNSEELSVEGINTSYP